MPHRFIYGGFELPQLSLRLVGWVSLLPLIFPISTIGLSQTTVIEKPDIYANFLGVLVGTGSYMKDDVRVTVPLQITITETKKKDAIRCDYIWSTKGHRDYALRTKVLTLLPATSEILQQWEGEDERRYNAKGLDEFSQIGFGTFTAVSRFVYSGQMMTRSTFQLQKDSFKYKSEENLDGHFVATQIILLTRAPNISTVAVK
jgi:hypothetical protein